MNKDFDNWNTLKKRLNAENTVPFFKEREIWWCSIGVNVGHEQDGKSEKFNRPVLVIRKFNNRLFWGVPLTTQIKDNKYYYAFDFKKRKQCAMMTHMRLWDANRLTSSMGRLGAEEFGKIRDQLAEYLQ
ncbi:MAG: type II toxin-antitoxin system PemK/MazF family toxin [Alphaproteobacteria bacterium]|nr:type II toxin-antitoxin system PemK/MazF family toxin [Alphaproteobacteria bacterium]